MNDRELRRNAEGYSDPTAYQAIKNIDREKKRRCYKMKQDRDEVIGLLKSDVNALVGFVNSIPHRRFEEDRFEYILIDHLTLALNLLESDMKADACKDCLVNEDK